MVALNHAVAVAMVQGPRAGLRRLSELESSHRLTDAGLGHDHRLAAVRGHLLELDGDLGGAATAYRTAALRTTSPTQQRYLRMKAARLD